MFVQFLRFFSVVISFIFLTRFLSFGQDSTQRIEVLYDTNLQVFTRYEFDKYNQLISSEQVLNANGLIKHGIASYFNKQGNITHTGFYIRGFKDSIWIYYFENSNKIREKRTYKNGQTDYAFVLYDSASQVPIEAGTMDQYDRKNGRCIVYFSDTSQIHLSGLYVHGKRHQEHIEYYKNGKIKRKEWYEYGKLKKGSLYNQQGKKIKYFPAFTYPSPPEKLYKYLAKKCTCFDELIALGDIQIQCYIREDGSIKWVNISHSNDKHPCISLLKQTIIAMKRWTPATIEGKANSFVYKTTFHQYLKPEY
jgi:Uncharacterized protein conserved in bacteria